MSASSTPTVRPRRARATARLTVTELLPTPPLPEAMASTRGGGRDVGDRRRPPGPSSRARSITALRSVGVHGPGAHVDRVHTGQRRRRGSRRRCSDLGPQRAAGDGQGHLDLDRAVLADVDGPDHAQIDDVGAELGVDRRASAGDRPIARPSSPAGRRGRRRRGTGAEVTVPAGTCGHPGHRRAHAGATAEFRRHRGQAWSAPLVRRRWHGTVTGTRASRWPAPTGHEHRRRPMSTTMQTSASARGRTRSP